MYARKTYRLGKLWLIAATILLMNLSFSHGLRAEERLSANDIDWCGENLTYYQAVGEYNFLSSQSWSMRARVCSHLYKDPLWRYEGNDRSARLIDRSTYYIEFEIQKSKERAETGRWNLEDNQAAKDNEADEKINELQHRIIRLEQELKNKDKMIEEQLRTINQLSK